MCVGTGGYRRARTRQIAPPRSAAQPCGTKLAWTAGHEKRESRRGAAVRRWRGRTDNDHFACSRRDRNRVTAVVKPKRINGSQKGVSLSSRKPLTVNADFLAFQLVSQHTL